MNDLYFWLLIIAFSFIVSAALYFCYKHFEISALFVALSVWVPHIFLQNSLEGSLQEETGIGSYIRIGILLAMGALGLIRFIQYLPKHKGKIPVQFLIVGIFLAFAFLSIFYSIDQNITFIRAATFMALAFYLLGLYSWLKQEDDFYKLLNTLYFLVLGLLILTAIVTALMPSRAWWWAGTRFIGIWGHPNTTGIFFLSTYPILIWKFNESNIYGKLLISGLVLFVLALHILTGSRTSLFASAVGVCTWFIVQKKALKSVVVIAVLGLTLFILAQARPESFERSESRQITDVTGRDEFWSAAIKLIEERPFTGYGYSVKGEVWTDPRFYKKGYALWSGSNKTSLHNGYLSVAVGLGVLGLLIWLLSLFIALFKGLNSTEPQMRNYKSFAISIMVMMLLVNFAESSLDSTASIGAIFFWIGWVISGKLYELQKQQGELPEVQSFEESYAA